MSVLEEAQGEQGQDQWEGLWTLQSPFKTTPNPGVLSCSVRPLPPPKPPADQFCLMPQPALAPLPSLVKSSLCKWPPTCPAATILKSRCMGCFCFSLLNWPLIFICWAGALNSVPPTSLLVFTRVQWREEYITNPDSQENPVTATRVRGTQTSQRTWRLGKAVLHETPAEGSCPGVALCKGNT